MNIHMGNIQKQTDERGFASIVIALTLVIILALLTVGFAQLTRREQQNALNKQLAVQAYYASEAGINDAAADITAHRVTQSNANCTPTPTVTAGTNYNLHNKDINSQLGVSYSCVSIDLNPTNLAYTNVSDRSFRTISFSSASGAKISTLTIAWTTADGQNTPPSSFLKQSSWTTNKYPAAMEISLTPLTSLDRASLTASDFTFYGYPVTGPGTTVLYASSSSATEGSVNDAHCTGGSCSITINVSSLNTTGPFLLHLTNHYDKSNIMVTGLDATNAAVKFQGGQAVIDSTGRARDVLKRLQVHVPIADGNALPNYAIEAGNVCKRITTYPNASGSGSTDAFHQSTNGLGAPLPIGSTDPCYLN
jgi:Tfp pilus assembly protein PilX